MFARSFFADRKANTQSRPPIARTIDLCWLSFRRFVKTPPP